MGQQKDKKNLKDLELAKKRDHKIMITDEAIKKYQEYNIKIYQKLLPILAVYLIWLKEKNMLMKKQLHCLMRRLMQTMRQEI